MQKLFAYGSLMCPDIMQLVSGLSLQGTPALLRGFQRCQVLNEPYPAIKASPTQQVEGMLYQGLLPDAWQRLDRFEGEMYQRRQVLLVDAHSQVIEACAYVIRPQYEHHLLHEEWSFEDFLRHGKAQFERDYRGFSEL